MNPNFNIFRSLQFLLSVRVSFPNFCSKLELIISILLFNQETNFKGLISRFRLIVLISVILEKALSKLAVDYGDAAIPKLSHRYYFTKIE